VRCVDLIAHPLAYARVLRGWSQEDLAREVRRAAVARGLRSGCDRRRVWKWEHKIAVPGAESQILLAGALGIPESRTEQVEWPYWLPAYEEPLPFASRYTLQALRESHGATMDRRSFTLFTGLSLVGLATQWAALEPARLDGALNGKRVDTELVAWLEGSAAHLTGLPTEQRQHTAALLDAHLGTVTDLIEYGRYHRTTGVRLHRLAATVAIAYGWYAFDHGQQAAAGRRWDAALRSAHAARDRDLGAGVVSDLAYQALWQGDPRTAADLLDRALSVPVHPVARSLLHLRKARAHAALGEPRATHQALGASEKALAARRVDPAPAWCSWMSPADLAVDEGGCLLELGHPQAANARIAEGVHLLPSARDKTRAVFLTYQARGLIARRDPEAAVALLTESHRIASRIGASRCLAQVRAVGAQLDAYASARGVAELRELVEPAIPAGVRDGSSSQGR
jgi:transcriptional regulator with XRE-family HTH domain